MRKDKLYKDPLRGKRKFLTIGSFVIFGVSAVVCNYLSFNMGRSNVMVDMINRVLEDGGVNVMWKNEKGVISTMVCTLQEDKP